MLEGVVVVELARWEPIVERRQLVAGHVVGDEVEIGEAVVVLDDFRKGEPPQRTIGNGAKKHDLARAISLILEALAVAPDDIRREQRERNVERGETPKPDEMLEREEDQADADHPGGARDPRIGNVVHDEQRQRRDIDEDGGEEPEHVDGFDHRRVGPRSDFHGIVEEAFTPFVERAPEIRARVDCLALPSLPFPAIGLIRKMADVIVASLLPMGDGERFAVMLAMKSDLDVLHAARRASVALGKADLHHIAPEHENVALLRSVEAAEIEKLPVRRVGRVILRRHIGVEELHAHGIASIAT